VSYKPFPKVVVLGLLTIFFSIALSTNAIAQTTYHLHKEASSTTGLNQLKTAGPDGTTVALTSVNLKNLATGEYLVKAFDTQSGVPNTAGVILSGSTVTFTLWLKKTASVGTMFPRAKLNLNSAMGASLCSTTGSTALTTTLTKYTLTCNTTANVSMTASDRFYVWVGVNLTATGSSNFQGSLNVEGTLNGNYNSKIAVPMPIPPPSISSLSATSAPVGTSITVSGANFGATQGTSALTFNGVAAAPTSWSATSIVAPVPAAATTGPVLVTVQGIPSNSVTFTVKPKINSLSPTSGSVGTGVTISGTTFGATQGTSTVTFNGTAATPTSWSATSITVPVPAGATTGPVIVTVNGSPSNGATFTVISTGTISGRITAGDSTTPIPGATVKALQGTSTIATTSTNGTGDYTLTQLDAGSYTINASATGYGNKSRSSVVVTGGANSTVNLSLDVIISGPVSYIYDPVGKLKATVGPIDTVVYDYDAVGNLLSIARQSSNQVAIIQLAPPSGPVGTNVTISGIGFSATPSQNTVTFNGSAATVTSATATQLIATVPAGATTGPVAVTSPNGSATSNTNFSVTAGNGPPTISSFTPNVGAAGNSVNITGTNFESTPTINKLKFSGSLAPVLSSTATTIVGSVPQTGSGRISVTTRTGSATSTGDFFVAPVGRPASDVVFTTRSSLGGTANVTINTAGKIGLVVFDATAGQRVTLGFTNITLGRVRTSLMSPNGSILAGPVYQYSNPGYAVMEPIQLPITGTYTVILDGYDPVTTSYSGSLNMQLYNTAPDINETISAGGPSLPISITTVGQQARLTFTGTAGQAASVNIGGTLPPTWVSFYKPDGSNLIGTSNLGGANGGFIDRQVLPTTGTYTIVIDPKDTYTATVDVTVYNLVDASGTLTPDAGATPVSLTVPGQNASFTFDGTTGQQLSIAVTGVTTTPGVHTNVYIYKPDGSLLASDLILSSMTQAVFDAITLPTSGTYRVFVDPQGYCTGSLNLAVYNAPNVIDTIALGESKTITVPVIGQKARVSYNGTAGQTIGVNLTNPTASIKVSVLKPDGSPFIGATNAPNFFPMSNLPATGAYTFVVDPQGSATGSVTLSLYENADITGTLVVNGTGMTITNNIGQNALLTFEGTAGQQITVRFTNNTVGNIYGRLLKPDGSMLSDVFSGAGTFTFGAASLPTTGTYKISIDPQWLNAGSVTVSVTNP
jgi:hypothetical protein